MTAGVSSLSDNKAINPQGDQVRRKDVSVRETLGARLTAIIIELHQSGSVDRQTLADMFNVSDRTIYRDLSRLSPIVELAGESRYSLSIPAKKVLDLELPKLFARFTKAENIFPNINDEFWLSLEERVQNNHINLIPESREHTLPDFFKKYFPVLEKAIKDQKICQIHYKNKNRKINPYKLINHNGIWYLKATESDVVKAFSLGRIEWLTVSDATFIPDSKIIAFLESDHNAWTNPMAFEVIISVSNKVAHYFKRRDILPQQKIISESKDELLLSCQIVDEKQIIPLVQYWLPNADIKEPIWLKEKLQENISCWINHQTTISSEVI